MTGNAGVPQNRIIPVKMDIKIKLPFKVGISPKLKIRGLIAVENIKKGRVIERCPLVLLDVKDEKSLEKAGLGKYYFDYTEKYNALVLGYGSLMNHSFKSNSEVWYDFKNETITFKATRNIKKGEEITFEYMSKKEIRQYPEYGIKSPGGKSLEKV